MSSLFARIAQGTSGWARIVMDSSDSTLEQRFSKGFNTIPEIRIA